MHRGAPLPAPEYEETHLFDLQTDLYKLKNIIDSEAHLPVKEEMPSRLFDLMTQAGEDLPVVHAHEQKPYAQRTAEYPKGFS